MMSKPIIAGTTITVALILGRLGDGESVEQILAAHPELTREAIYAALPVRLWGCFFATRFRVRKDTPACLASSTFRSETERRRQSLAIKCRIRSTQC